MSARILTERPEPLLAEVEPDVDREARYGIYVLREGEPVRVAECERDAIGTALVQLADDAREAGETTAETYGVLDQIERRWISGLWPPDNLRRRP